MDGCARPESTSLLCGQEQKQGLLWSSFLISGVRRGWAHWSPRSLLAPNTENQRNPFTVPSLARKRGCGGSAHRPLPSLDFLLGVILPEHPGWCSCHSRLSISESRALGLGEQTGGKSHSPVTPPRGCPLGTVVGGREIQAHVFSLMVGQNHCLNGHEFEQTPGDSKGQGSLECCSPWSRKESDTM